MLAVLPLLLVVLLLGLGVPLVGQVRLSVPGADDLVFTEAGGSREAEGSIVALRLMGADRLGQIHATLVDRVGRAHYLAAEEGLFQVCWDHDAVERVAFDGDAPDGVIRSMLLDRQRRLWLRTDRSLFATETSRFRCRRVTSDLDPTAASALGVDRGGVVRDGTGRELHRPPPGGMLAAAGVLIDGIRRLHGARVDTTYGDVLEVQVSDLPEGATVLWSIGAHHKQQWSGDGRFEVRDLAPGTRVLRVWIEGPGLWVSPPTVIRFEVAMPTILKPRVFLPLIVGFALLVIGGSAFVGWRRHGRRHLARSIVSGGLIVWITGMLVSGFFAHARGWPFCGYGMYTATVDEGQVVSDVRIVGLREDGTWRSLYLKDLGAQLDSKWIYIRQFLLDNAGRQHAPDRAAALIEHRRALVAAARERSGDPKLVGVAIVATRSRILRDGPIELPTHVRGFVLADGAGG